MGRLVFLSARTGRPFDRLRAGVRRGEVERGMHGSGAPMLIEREEACLCGLPAARQAQNRVRSDEESGVKQPWEPLRAFQRTVSTTSS